MARPSATQMRASAKFWRSFQMFEFVGDETLAALSVLAKPQEWSAGTLLFQRGDPGSYMIALRDGRIKLSVATPDGHELVLAHVEGGDILGEMAVIDDEPRSADATALLPSSGLVVERSAFLELSARQPDLMLGVARFLSKRLRNTNDKLESLALYSLEARVARFLLVALRGIHGDELPDEPVLRLDLSQSELAAMLGASRPKVNHVLQHFAESGAVRREGANVTCNVAMLQKLAEPGLT